jgi:uncharacterized protein YjiS (DUF1127 family)
LIFDNSSTGAIIMARSYVSHPVPGGIYAASIRLSTVLLAGVSKLVRSYRHRRQVAKLLAWDDRGLEDIGVTRADVQLALGLPATEDPSFRLRMWALERRSARLAAQREARKAADRYARSAGVCGEYAAGTCH